MTHSNACRLNFQYATAIDSSEPDPAVLTMLALQHSPTDENLSRIPSEGFTVTEATEVIIVYILRLINAPNGCTHSTEGFNQSFHSVVDLQNRGQIVQIRIYLASDV